MLSDASTKRKEIEEGKAGLLSRFSKSESAAVTAIIAILLLGLIFTIISVVKLEYVPEWKNDAEQDHAYDLWDDMTGLKENIDMFSRLMESDNYSKNSFSATVPFNTGGGEVPVFESSKSYGKLEVNTERCRIAIKPYTADKNETPYYTFECNGISCFSGSRQYPDQIYRYENGALILADGKSSIMKQFPAFTIEENKTNKGNYTVTIRPVELLGKPNSVSSNSLTPLRLTGWGVTKKVFISDNNTTVNAFDMTITTKYPHAWYAYFNGVAQAKGLIYGKDYTVNFIPNSVSPNSVCFHSLPSGNKTLERLYINETIINAEIIPIRYQNVMKLKQWYSFDTASDTTLDLYNLRDYGSPVDLTIQNTNPALNGYKSSNIFTYDLKNNPFESIFGFSSFTEFESQPSSAKILMIYQLPDLNNPPYPYMTFAGNTLNPTLTEGNGKNWYLYTQTIPAASIKDPSDLHFYLKIDAENGKKIDIDYLGVYLS